MVSHSYSDLTIKKLYSLSGNLCSFLNCNQELITTRTKVNVSDICHIEGGEPNSPRYNSKIQPEQLDDYENLIVMCKTHHKIIDSDVLTYTVEHLKKMKKEHEQSCKGKEYAIDDDIVKKIIADQITQMNVNTGSGNQNITQTGSITQIIGISSLADAEKLIELLFQQNFPKLKEESQKIARNSAEKFCQTFLSRLKSELNPEDIQKVSDPDFQFVLNSSVIQAGRKDEQELRENLAYLLVERIKNSNDNLRSIVYNEAIETIGKLTQDELKIIALTFLLRYTKFTEVENLQDLNNLLARVTSPFLNFKNTNAEFQHIEYTGCGSIGFGSWNYLDSIVNSYPELIPFVVSTPQVQFLQIPENIFEEIFEKISDTECKFKIVFEPKLVKYIQDKKLIEITKNSIIANYQSSRNNAINKLSELIKDKEFITNSANIVFETPLKSLSLTSVGIAIAAIYCERILEQKFDITNWIN